MLYTRHALSTGLEFYHGFCLKFETWVANVIAIFIIYKTNYVKKRDECFFISVSLRLININKYIAVKNKATGVGLFIFKKCLKVLSALKSWNIRHFPCPIWIEIGIIKQRWRQREINGFVWRTSSGECCAGHKDRKWPAGEHVTFWGDSGHAGAVCRWRWTNTLCLITLMMN